MGKGHWGTTRDNKGSNEREKTTKNNHSLSLRRCGKRTKGTTRDNKGREDMVRTTKDNRSHSLRRFRRIQWERTEGTTRDKRGKGKSCYEINQFSSHRMEIRQYKGNQMIRSVIDSVCLEL